uniref:Uncharacterized protein n=1 Tax=Corethron hystrix TaxID=216773 RepID=A0A7S1FZ77_9STRA
MSICKFEEVCVQISKIDSQNPSMKVVSLTGDCFHSVDNLFFGVFIFIFLHDIFHTCHSKSKLLKIMILFNQEVYFVVCVFVFIEYSPDVIKFIFYPR